MVSAPPDVGDAHTESSDAWSTLRAAWDVVPGSSSEVALAIAVLLDRDRYASAVVEAALAVLARPRVDAVSPLEASGA